MPMTNSKLSPLSLPTHLPLSPANPPHFGKTVKDLNGREVVLGDPAVTRGLVAIMDMAAVNGGAACHWGGPAAFAETMSVIHGHLFAKKKSRWFDDFNFINDAGHTENGIYALRANLGYEGLSFDDLLNFRDMSSKLTGHGEAHVYPEGVLISNGPLGSAVSQAQGLAFADKLTGNARTTICTISDGALMEGEAKEAFAAIPGLALKGKLNPFVLAISFNNKKLSGTFDNDAFSIVPTLNAFTALGWKVITLKSGHDLQAVYTGISEGIASAQQDATRPICLIIETQKGHSVKSTMDQASGGHGFPLKARDPQLKAFLEEIFSAAGAVPAELIALSAKVMQPKPASPATSTTPSTPTATPSVPEEKIQVGVASALIAAATEGLPVFSVSADLQSSTGVKGFQDKFPHNHVEVGVAESNMISMASGLSKAGYIPIVDTFAQFGVTKGNLPLTMSSLSEAPVIGIFSHTGFQDAADGASHQATTYLAATMAIPDVVTVCCSCSSEAHAYVYQAAKRHATDRPQGKSVPSVLFFLGRENFPKYFGASQPQYRWGEVQTLHAPTDPTTADLLIVATGSSVHTAMKALPSLLKKGINPIIVNNPFVNRPDLTTLQKLLVHAKGRLVTIEDHQIVGGMGEHLVARLQCLPQAKNLPAMRSTILGIDGHFGRSAYSAEELSDRFGIGVQDLVQASEKMLQT
jgi:transketolase